MNADWVMVIITAIYATATIYIMFANRTSAKTARAQLVEMKREHDETSRIQVMPYLRFQVGECRSAPNKSYPDFEIDVDDCKNSENGITVFIPIEVENIGQGLATNLTCSWNNGRYTKEFPVDYLQIKEKRGAYFEFSARIGSYRDYPLSFGFSDLLGNHYTQNFVLCIFAQDDCFEIEAHKTGFPQKI